MAVPMQNPPPPSETPPPGPSIPWATPLPSGAPMPTGGWGMPSFASGSQTRYGAERIRSSISLYRVLVIIQVIGAVLGAVVSIATRSAYLGGVGGIGPGSSGSSTFTGGAAIAAVAALAALGAVLVIVLLILTIIAWVRWRDGIRRIASESGAMGASQFHHAQAAKKNYSYTVWTFLLYIVAIVIALVILVAAIFAAVGGSLHLNNTTGQFTNSPTNVTTSLGTTLVYYLAGVALLGSVFNFLLYYFASTSLREAIAGVATPEALARLNAGRQYILCGVVLGFGSVLSLLISYAALIGAVGTIFLLLGFTALLDGYDKYLAAPPAGGLAPPG
ncbi:MAG: hypothetical protein L3K23_05515 [Thermoplasmata archaeon]|nr:hypothetical protein [Thermoplasmata archaeon]